MKKILTLSVLLPTLALGQSLVGTSPENRTALLEDFTGIHCVYCPEGHVIMEQVATAHPGLVSLVGIHAGSFAVPSAGEPDFRTPQGNALNSFYQPAGYPMGMLNRHAFGNATVLNRGQWPGAADDILAMPSPVNLGVESSYDEDTQELTVRVQLYYTQDSPGNNDRISVLITESNIIGPQTGGSANYNHKHVLRTYVTDLWGEDVGSTPAGTMVERTYTYSVPGTWNIANCDVIAFVSEYQGDVYQARTVQAVGGTTLVTAVLQGDAAPYRSGAASASTDYSLSMTNALGEDAAYTVTLTTVQAPASWTGSLTVNGSAFTSGDAITVNDASEAQIQVHITPDAAAGIGSYLLTIASVDHPLAPVLQQDLHVISGVHDLIVSNAGAEQWEALYIAAMDEGGEAAYATTSQDDFIKFGQAGALAGVGNIYRNISWNFPSYTEAEVAILMPFMDNGGNLMIAGQDIGWDQSGDANAYGTPVTRAFYTNYLLATFVHDGSPSSNQVIFVQDDPVFGNLPNSSVAHVFGGSSYTYPDRITPIAPATAILGYNTPANSIGGIRAQTANYKLVYFGIGPEQISNATVGRQMIQLSHDWFHGLVGVQELDASFASLGLAWPVPANDVLHIPVDGTLASVTVEVFDATGRLVLQQNLSGAGNDHLDIDTRSLRDGLYSYRLRTAQAMGKARPFVVQH